MQHYKPWTPSAALTPLLSTTLAIVYALYILAYPPQHRNFAFLALCLPITLAFKTQLHLTPWFTINDTFGRFLYIWLAHMSHTILLSPTPSTPSNEPRRAQLKQAYNRLFARHPPHTPASPRRRGAHTLDRRPFCTHHVMQATLMLSLLWMWDTYLDVPTSYTPIHTSLLRRIPASLSAAELHARFAMTVSVCVADMLYFEAVHSLFAVLFVGILRFDDAGKWGVRLFGSLADCWSVRRYWGVYWHDYVYVSFSAHAKVLTRRGLRMRTPGAARRVLENGLVFGVSGIMHSVVRWVQTGGEGEVWCVAIWYTGQMLALVGEGVVQHLWANTGVRGWLEKTSGKQMVATVEKVVGYVWVFCWMFWSVPKYLLTRNAWEMANWRKKYSGAYSGYNDSIRIDL